MGPISLIIAITSTGIASAWHGGNFTTKGIPMAIHAVLTMLTIHLMGASDGTLLAGVIVSLAWWFTLRRKSQAKSELDYQSSPVRNNRLFKPILISYIPFFVLVPIFALVTGGYLMALVFAVLGLVGITLPSYMFHQKTGIGQKLHQNAIDKFKKTGHQDGVFDERRAVELATGMIPGGLFVYMLLELCMIVIPIVVGVVA
jgi:hypothetical protein